jgi:hypothetical protein
MEVMAIVMVGTRVTGKMEVDMAGTEVADTKKGDAANAGCRPAARRCGAKKEGLQVGYQR